MGDGVRLIDSAEETAAEVKEVLRMKIPLNPPLEKGGQGGFESGFSNETPMRRYFVTDVPRRFEEQGSRFLGEKIGKVEKVNLIL